MHTVRETVTCVQHLSEEVYVPKLSTFFGANFD
jgi:hypothetical protein